MKISTLVKGTVVLALIAAAAYAVYFWKKGQPSNATAQYRTATVAQGDIRQLVTASGQVEPVVNVLVGSQISGTIERILVDYNSIVTNGQVLAQIDPASYRTSLKQAEAELANATASLDLARINARRAERLYLDHLISESDSDTAKVDLRQAEAIVLIREAMVDKARVDLDRTTIYSPIDGVVISRDVEVGQTVAASFNTPRLFTIANDLSRMHIHANVSEADIGGVHDGLPVDFIVDAFPARKFTGVVEQVRNAPTTNQNVVTYTTVIAVSNPEAKLKPGMTANVSITLAESRNVLKIPNAALRFRPPDPQGSDSPSQVRSVSMGGSGPGAGGLRAATPVESGQRPQMERREGGPGVGRAANLLNAASASSIDQPDERTVYLLAFSTNGTPLHSAHPQAVTIRTGITDGAFTEVLQGLREGDTVIVGSLSLTAATPAATPNNPFAPQRPGGRR
jgi:HlyD family secretion protein